MEMNHEGQSEATQQVKVDREPEKKLGNNKITSQIMKQGKYKVMISGVCPNITTHNQ